MTRKEMTKIKAVQLLRPGAYETDSIRYARDWDNGHIIEFKVNSLFVGFTQEDTILLEGPDGISRKVLILRKVYEADYCFVRGLVKEVIQSQAEGEIKCLGT